MNNNNSSLLLFLLGLVFFTHCKNSDPALEILKTIHPVEIHKLESDENLDFITTFQFADDETIWVGTFNRGIYHISGNGIINFNTTNSSLPNNRINDLFIDNLNKLWIATNNGLAMYQNNQWEVYNSENTPLLSPNVNQVVVNNRNEILIGGGNVIDGGLFFRTQGGQWKKYSEENSLLPYNVILDIELSNDQNFWIGTGKGIAKFENQRITNVLNIEKSGLLYNWVDNLEISNDQLWIGFAVDIYDESGPDGGIQRIDLQNQDITSYLPYEKTGLVSNRVRSLKIHSDNSIWFTTMIDHHRFACEGCFAGIGMLSQNNEFLAISTLNSEIEPNAFIPKLSEDNNGNMYAASELSIFRLELLE
jgi:ligand-binding sensor domain-containing protein